MRRPSWIVFSVALSLAGSPTARATASAPAPRSYPVACRPSELLRRHDALLALVGQVRTDLESDARAGRAADAATTRKRCTTLFQCAVIERDTSAAARALACVRATLDAASARSLAGLFTEPYLEARLAPGADLHGTYRERLARRLEALEYEQVDFTLKAMRGQMAGAVPDTAVGTARSALDPLLQEGRLPAEAAEAVIALAVQDELVNSVRPDILAGLDATIAAHARDTKPFDPPIGRPRIPVRGAWFGQPRPGLAPVRFAPAVLAAINPWCFAVAFSPDGKECFASIGGATYGGSRIVHATCEAGTWSAFSPPACMDGFVTTLEAHYAPDGRSLYFTAQRAGEYRRLYAVTRTRTGWGAPVPVPGPITSEGDAYRGSRSNDGTWYFGLQLEGMPKICRATPGADGNWRIEPLGPPINQQTYDGDPCIAPDGRWLVFHSARAGSVGGVDLYVSFADGRGGWGAPVHLGPGFNTPDDEYGAMLSPDGRQFFFTRHTATHDEVLSVDVEAIDAMRSKAMRGP